MDSRSHFRLLGWSFPVFYISHKCQHLVFQKNPCIPLGSVERQVSNKKKKGFYCNYEFLPALLLRYIVSTLNKNDHFHVNISYCSSRQ